MAAGLARYFENRTEIEYSVLVQKMKELPEGQILDLLGIKGKEKEEDSKPTIKKKDAGLMVEDEKEAENFMEELKQQAKEELEKEKTDREQTERKEKEKARCQQDEEEAIKQQELKAQNLATNKIDTKPKVKSLVKDCSMNMGKKVSNRSPVKVLSPVKVDTSTDSDCMIISADGNDAMQKKGKIDTKEGSLDDQPLNLSTGKRMANETDAASVTSSGAYFSDSDEFCKAVALSKQNNGFSVDVDVQEAIKVDNTVDKTSDSGGVFFSDEEEFKRLKAIADKNVEAEQKTDDKVNETKEEEEKENKVGNGMDDKANEMKDTTVTDSAEVEATTKHETDEDTDNSGGVFFSYSDEIKCVKALAKGKLLSEGESGAEGDVESEVEPLFQKDCSETDDCEMRNNLDNAGVDAHPAVADDHGHDDCLESEIKTDVRDIEQKECEVKGEDKVINTKETEDVVTRDTEMT